MKFAVPPPEIASWSFILVFVTCWTFRTLLRIDVPVVAGLFAMASMFAILAWVQSRIAAWGLFAVLVAGLAAVTRSWIVGDASAFALINSLCGSAYITWRLWRWERTLRYTSLSRVDT